MTPRIQLEILVILATTVFVLFAAWNTFSAQLSVCVTVCLCCQFLTLTLKTYLDNQQPHIRQLFRSKADLGYLCSMLVPLTVVADLVFIARQNVFIDMLEWLDEHRKTLHGIVDIWGLDHQHKAQVYNHYAYSMLGCAFLASSMAALAVITNRDRSNRLPSTCSLWTMSVFITASAISSSVMLVMAGTMATVMALVLSVLVFLVIFHLPNHLPRTFTLGELSCSIQLLAVLLWKPVHVYTSTDIINFKIYSIDSLHAIIFVALLVIIIMYVLLPATVRGERPWVFYVVFTCVSAVLVVPASYLVLRKDIVTWMFTSIFKHPKRVSLLLYWLVCSVVAAVLSLYQGSSAKGDTITRKSFHLVIVAVYIPGLLVDAEFLHLASVCAGAFLLLLEVIDSSFKMFVDDKDEGPVILTHIYLLVGLSLPLWISSIRPVNGALLPMYSGVISLGVGDTAASVGGVLLGQHKWPESNKSLEGTALCAISQALVMACLTLSGGVSSPLSLSLVLPVILSSLYEAFTLQVDNLVLPLLTYSLLCVS
ncbi:dolichol kinase-like isoform X2 [Haliotis rufescens]|uniref:dolichol kinase-like isoform X2 n=1 Tax=Haliotis rufescens TaxID=6454 RepID=UPI00201FACB5|nr:dolichol kinase-like isoform X2 [Haliotis rufescens]